MSIIVPHAPFVNFFSPTFAPAPADDYRPTAGPDFFPTPEEEAEAAALLNAEDDEPDDEELAARYEESVALDAMCSGCWA